MEEKIFFPFPGATGADKILMRPFGKWDITESCAGCGFSMVRRTEERAGKEKVELFYQGKPVTLDGFPETFNPGKTGVVCVSGIKTLKEALVKDTVNHPEKNRCYQRTSRDPRS